jgi:DNA-binding CsgD family transcriptional regulator
MISAGSKPPATDETVAQARLFEHVLGLLGRLSEDRPLLVVLEDLHWADRSTRDLVRFLVRSLRRERVLLILTYRSDDLHRRHPLLPLLSELARLERVESVTLGRLDRAATASLLAGILDGEPDTMLVSDLFARSDGNPFFVEELIAFGQGPAEAVPTTIREIVGVRVARLSEPSQAVLRIASVVGRRFDHDQLARLADLDDETIVERIRPAVDEQIALAIDDGLGPAYEFRHALVQEALYDDLLPAERTTLHARLAAILDSRRVGGDPRRPSQAEIAHHWFRAHDLARALTASVQAAEEAADLVAFAEVNAQLERVLELWPGVPDPETLAGMDRAEVLQRAADAAAAIGAYPRAIALGREALVALDAAPSPDRWLEASHRLAWYQWDHGDARGAEETVLAARSIGEGASVLSRVTWLTDLAQLHWSASRFSEQEAAAAEALSLSSAAVPAAVRAQAEMMHAVAEVTLGRITSGLEELEHSLIGHEGGPEDRRVLAVIEMQHALIVAGYYERSVAYGYREMERLRAGGLSRRFSAYLVTDLVDSLIELGRWTEARTLLDDPDWPRIGSRASAWMFHDTAELAAAQGEFERARTAIAEARSRATPGDATLDQIWLLRVEGIVAAATGEPEDASVAFWSAIGRSAEPDRDRPLAFWVVDLALSNEADLAEIARANRDLEAERDALERGRRLVAIVEGIAADASDADASDADTPSHRAFVAVGRAESTRLEGRSDPGAWAVAAATLDATSQPYSSAIARYHEATALLERGWDRPRVTASLRHAHAVATELSARPLLERIETLATRARIVLATDDAPSALPPPKGPSDPYGLTNREREVLELVSLGRTNREIGEALFISEKTASVHVTHILGKLDVSSRVEAALAASRAGLVEGP